VPHRKDDWKSRCNFIRESCAYIEARETAQLDLGDQRANGGAFSELIQLGGAAMKKGSWSVITVGGCSPTRVPDRTAACHERSVKI
jgi:hypothetical protein